MRYIQFLLPILLLYACAQPIPKRFIEHDAAAVGINFKNTITEDAAHNMIDYSYVYNGGGVGATDLDGDGLPDLFFTGNQVPCRLYRNLGQFKFQDITATSGIHTDGWCTGVTFADINSDGLTDIYVCRSGNLPAEKRGNLCFINRGNFVFEEQAEALGLANTGWSTQAAFFDYDSDGDLDCYVLNATNTDRYPNRIKENRKLDGSDPASDQLYRNDKGHFVVCSQAAGIADDAWGLGVAIADFNGDTWPDIYVTNDFLANDLLYLNQQNGTFKNATADWLGHTSHFSMGCDAADMNNDGFTDLITADMMPSTSLQRKKMAGVLSPQSFQMVLDKGYMPQYMRNTLQLNTGTGFSEIGQLAGVYATDWSWSPLFADFDLDGQLDLSITSGYRHDIIDMDFIQQNSELGRQAANLAKADAQIRERARQQPGYASPVRFLKNGGDLLFADMTTTWTTGKPVFANGSTVADLDQDGDIDLIVNNIDALPGIFENTTLGNGAAPDAPKPNWLKVQFRTTTARPADTKIYIGATIQTRHNAVTRGYQSAGDNMLYFGLGAATVVDSIQIYWQNGPVQTLTHVAANQILTIEQPQEQLPIPKTAVAPPIFHTALAPGWKHSETPYNDFDVEPLLPHQFSQEGPDMAVADLNGDGREDFFVCGANKQSGSFFIQQANGSFAEQPLDPTRLPKTEEDVACILFDADQDHDADLLLISGGVEMEPNGQRYSPRLYLNDGQAHFTSTTGRLPISTQPGSCVCAADFDRDGDLDLFIGGRRHSLQYGLPGTNFLLRNNGQGYFENSTEALAPGLQDAGMVTTATWADMDGDQALDLVVAGEWMPMTIFFQKNNHFERTEIPESAGFWRCIQSADLDNDGDLDLVAGNLGTNNKFGISPETPLTVYAKDMDGNGRFDPVISYFIQNKCVLAHGRDELMRQLPRLRKSFNSYNAYAKTTFNDVFNQTMLQDAHIVTGVTAQSTVWLNAGKGHFSALPLPVAAQTAPIRAIQIEDIDHDGHPDMLAVGNDYAWEPGSGRMDASEGWYLKGDGTGHFRAILAQQSGFRVRGEGRAIKKIHTAKPIWIVLRNNDTVLFFN